MDTNEDRHGRMLWNRLKSGDRLVIRCACGQEHQIEKRGKTLGLITVAMVEVRRAVKRFKRGKKA